MCGTVEAERGVEIGHAVKDDGRVGCVMNGQEWEGSGLRADDVGAGSDGNQVVMK